MTYKSIKTVVFSSQHYKVYKGIKQSDYVKIKPRLEELVGDLERKYKNIWILNKLSFVNGRITERKTIHFDNRTFVIEISVSPDSDDNSVLVVVPVIITEI